jgi:hypothetical protein
MLTDVVIMKLPAAPALFSRARGYNLDAAISVQMPVDCH